MTYHELSSIIFKKNYKKYVLYFICNALAIAIFQSFAAIFANQQFMNPNIVDPQISSDIFAPSFFVALFSVFFIPYSHFAFKRNRNKEFGIFISIGIEIRKIIKTIVYESTLIAIISTFIGLILGTFISFGMYDYIETVIKIPGLHFKDGLSSYGITILCFFAIYTLTIAISAFSTYQSTVLELIKSHRKAQVGLRSNRILFGFGWAILLFSFIYLFTKFDQNHNNFLAICFLTCTMGLCLIIFNLTVLIDFMKKYFEPNYYKHLFLCTSIVYRFQSNKKILCLTISLLGILIFFQTFPLATAQISKNMEVSYCPYQIAYSEIYGMNKISDKCLKDVENNSHTRIIDNKKIEFINNNGTAIFSDEAANQISKLHYDVKRGTFIPLLQYDEKDGRMHQESSVKVLIVSLGNKTIRYKSAGDKPDILYGFIYAMPANTAIINQNDYSAIKKDAKGKDTGVLRLINIDSADRLHRFGDTLQKKLGYNNLKQGESDTDFYRISSKYEYAKQEKQTNQFMSFLFTAMNSLIFMAVMIMLHFRLLIYMEEDVKKYNSIIKVGISLRKLAKMIRGELFILFIIPTIIAVIGSILFCYALYSLSDVGAYSVMCSIIIGTILILLQWIFCLFYLRYYKRKLTYFSMVIK